MNLTKSTRVWLGVAVMSVIVVAVIGLVWRSSRPVQPSDNDTPQDVTDSARPVFTELTPEVVRSARFIDMDSSIRERETRAQEIEQEEADWASSVFLPATSAADTLTNAWESSVRDPDGVLTPAQRDALLTKIADYVRVRALPTPEAYFRLAEREPNLAWHDPVAPYSDNVSKPFRDQLAWLYENYGDGPADPAADTPKLLRDLWPMMMGTYGQRIADVGVGERGAAIIIMRSRLPARATNGGFAEPYASLHGLDVNRWVGYGVSWARPFRVPLRTSDDVLDEHGIVTLFAAHLIVRLASAPDHLFVWGVYGFLDPETNEWQVELMDKSGSRNWQVVF